MQSGEGLRPSYHLLQVSQNVSYGLTRNKQAAIQLFSSIGADGQARVDGMRAELLAMLIKPEDEEGDGYWAGGIFKFGKLPATLSNNNLDAEIMLPFGFRKGRWTIGGLPAIGVKVAGNGSGQPDINMRLKLAYRIEPEYSVGIEQYSDLGNTHKIGPLNQQSQQTFAVVDIKRKDWDVNIGVGRGWNDFSERWVVKAIIGFPLGH